MDFALHIKPGVIEFLTAEEGLKQYDRYVVEYEDEGVRRFAVSDYYKGEKVMQFDEEYFIRMISNFGEVPPDLKEAYLKNYRGVFTRRFGG